MKTGIGVVLRQLLRDASGAGFPDNQCTREGLRPTNVGIESNLRGCLNRPE